ncbi:hypothetical protein [Agreia sp. Leaf244]|uniref:hypothetical protein n=1 Tax=Agreia sp. Leaf244 TaxID=1736305 RepID=UPI0006F390BA|nr:hypothetical protein [Agreia sp. Leaf244]
MRVIVFVLCLAAFVAGMVVMAYAFDGEGGFIGEVFVGGVLLSSAAVFVPMSVLRWLDRA